MQQRQASQMEGCFLLQLQRINSVLFPQSIFQRDLPCKDGTQINFVALESCSYVNRRAFRSFASGSRGSVERIPVHELVALK
jgi:hypothetical protein